ncbi:concanavalin A-like lectin/glucanase domain-containing protein [Lipomyces chichibuensis]|uniref:concanavalin A-like lectin/glucanase domain-containing protein n=1 Tax=Lipomyces chichibuensis TaxID=1546026 RepID=UPI0033438FF3
MKLQALLTALMLLRSLAQANSASADEDFPQGVKRVPLRTHSLASPYLDDSLHSRWFDYGGDAVIRTDKYIRLTADRASQTGYVSSRLPLTMPSFEIEFEFKISGKGNLYGDGMAMWITKERDQMGPVFGGPDNFEGLGIFIDTYKNNRPGVTFPYVMAMVGDGKTRYSKEDDGKPNELAGCSARGLHNSQHVTKARLIYVKDNFMRLDLEYKEPNKWTPCFKVAAPPLPSVAYLGFSAETGELSEHHDLISVDVSTLFLPSGQERTTGMGSRTSHDQRVRKEKKRGSWFWFFVKLGLIGGAAYVGYTRYIVYAKNKQQSNQGLF